MPKNERAKEKKGGEGGTDVVSRPMHEKYGQVLWPPFVVLPYQFLALSRIKIRVRKEKGGVGGDVRL